MMLVTEMIREIGDTSTLPPAVSLIRKNKKHLMNMFSRSLHTQLKCFNKEHHYLQISPKGITW